MRAPAIETATIGREGAVGLHGALGKRFSFTRATIQIGGNFSTIRASAFARFAEDHAPVRFPHRGLISWSSAPARSPPDPSGKVLPPDDFEAQTKMVARSGRRRRQPEGRAEGDLHLQSA